MYVHTLERRWQMTSAWGSSRSTPAQQVSAECRWRMLSVKAYLCVCMYVFIFSEVMLIWYILLCFLLAMTAPNYIQVLENNIICIYMCVDVCMCICEMPTSANVSYNKDSVTSYSHLHTHICMHVCVNIFLCSNLISITANLYSWSTCFYHVVNVSGTSFM